MSPAKAALACCALLGSELGRDQTPRTRANCVVVLLTTANYTYFLVTPLLHSAEQARRKESSLSLHRLAAMKVLSSLLLWFNAASAEKDYQFCIVGGGPGGVQLGHYFEKAGQNYHLFERNDFGLHTSDGIAAYSHHLRCYDAGP
jgi:hypothetical protein